MTEKKLGFVIPWYSEDITGGAETELRRIEEELKNRQIREVILKLNI